MWYDRDIDRVMRRTASRPLPAGRMLPGEALGFGCVLAVGSVAVMGIAVNWVAAELLALTMAFYVFVYTMWLKRRTPQNIVIGGAAGRLPPLIGWAAVTGDVGWGAIALFAIIFFWTPPHFWRCRSTRPTNTPPPHPDAAGGFRRARDQAADAALHPCAVAVTAAPWFLGLAGPVYAAGAGGLSALFTLCAVRVWRDESDRSARQMFAFSLVYLFLIFALLLADHGMGGAR